ncbi:MAG: hypothetical protein AAF658_10255, partial [Myxococcota bacterium]
MISKVEACLSSGVLVCLFACAAPTPIPAVSPAPPSTLVERAPGYVQTPLWFAGESLTEVDGDLVGVGRVRLDAVRQLEAGFRASDSYARAELAGFVASRVSRWFHDLSASGSTTAQSLLHTLAWESEVVLGAAPIVARYWEKHRTTESEVVDVVSLARLRAEDVELVLDRVGRRTGIDTLTIQESFAERFRTLEVQALESRSAPPKWASAGDRLDGGSYLMVCSAESVDAKSAEVFARARCEEKLCKLFGEELIAGARDRQSDSDARPLRPCPSVRAVNWQTRFDAAECGPDGCVKWLLQSYPVVEYERERERRSSPALSEQDFSVEWAKVEDPGECEDLLNRYRLVEGVRAKDYETRTSLLALAARACAGSWDPEFSERLDLLLTQPIPEFTAPVRGSVAHLFASLPAGFMESLAREESLAGRIAKVRSITRNAVLPLRAVELYEDGIADPRTIERVMAPLLEAPFEVEPVAPSHAINWHEILVDRLLNDRMPPVPAYRLFLLQAARSRDYECWAGSSLISAKTILEYFNKDEELDEEEWRVAQKLVSRASRSRDLCWKPIFKGTPEEKR